MALEINIDGVDRAYAVRLIGGTASQAFHTESAAMAGVVSSGLIEVEDPDGSLDLVGWTQFNIVETTATPDRIATGWLANIDQTYGPFRVGPGRIHICETVDLNWYLTRIALEQGTPKRPAETDLARVTWLLGNASLNGRVYAGDLTDLTNNPVNLGEADYTDQFPIDVLTDICPVAGKTAYVTWDYTNNRAQLFYDLTTTTTYDSPAAISDGEGDANGTTVFAPRNDPVLHRVIEDGYSDVYLRTKVGLTHVHDAAFEAAHARRDLVLSTSRIGNPDTALAYANKALNAHNHETDSIDVEVEVDASHVNDILEGHRLYYKSTHFTGFTDYAYTRVERRTVRQVDDQSRRFVLGLQLSDRILSALPGGPPPSDFPQPPDAVTALGIVQVMTRQNGSGGTSNYKSYPDGGGTWDTVVAGHLLVLGVTAYDGAAAQDIPTPAGWTAATAIYHPSGTGTDTRWSGRLFYRAAAGGETISDIATGFDEETVVLAEFDGPGTLVDTETGAGANAGGHASNQGNRSPTFPAMTCTAGQPILGVGWWAQTGQTALVNTAWGGTIDQPTGFPLGWPSSGGAGLGSAMVMVPVASSSGTERVTGTMYDNNNFPFWSVALFSGTSTTTSSPPAPGQLVPWTVVAVTPGSTTSTGTTAFPYADGSLQIKVDGVLISPASYEETDPAAGDFTLDWVIDTDEVVTVQYLGR